MKAFILSVICALCLGSWAEAQNHELSEISTRRHKERIDAEVVFRIQLQDLMTVKARIVLQGNCYYAEGMGYRIFCDGKSRWAVHEGEKEVYIDTPGGDAELAEFAAQAQDLSIIKLKYLPLSEDMSIFSFDTGKLDEEWIITDLRQE